MYLWNGGDAGGSGSSGGSGGDPDDPGGGSGVIVNPDFDVDNNNILDCYKRLMTLGANTLTITSGFRTAERPDHDGIDIGSTPDRNACYGRFVYSVCRGTVSEIYYSRRGGWTVILTDDNGYEWGICHLLNDPHSDSSVNLYVGKRVYPGITPIGRCNSTGENCDGPHIHLSLKINNTYENPAKYVSGC